MKRILSHFMALALLAVGMVFLIGCDSSKPTDDGLPMGNVSDPEFQTASEAVAFTEETDAEMLDDLYDIIGGIDQANPAPGRVRAFARSTTAAADSFLATYNSGTNYWTIYFGYTSPFDSSTWVYRDSIQFRSNGVPQQWPDTTVDEIRAGKSLDVTFGGGGMQSRPSRNPNLNRSAASGSLNAQREWILTGAIPQEGDVVVNGSGTTDISAQNVGDDSCNWDISLASTIANLAVNIADAQAGACPTGGTINHNGSITVVCSGPNAGSFSDEWTQSITYTPNGITVTASNSRASWTWSGSCDDRPGDDDLEEGDDNGDEIRAFENGIEEVFDATGGMAEFVFFASAYIALQGPVDVPSRVRSSSLTADSVSAVYNQETQYWNVYLQVTDSAEGQSATITCAIQFLQNGDPMQWPDSVLTTEIRSEMDATFALFEPGSMLASSGALSGHHSWSFESVEGPIWNGDLIANGPVSFNGDYSAQADSASCAYGFEVNGEIDRLKFDPAALLDDACPTAGVIEFRGGFSLNCNGPRGALELSDEWVARYAFNEDGSHDWHFESTRNFWDGTSPCHEGTSVATSPARLTAAR